MNDKQKAAYKILAEQMDKDYQYKLKLSEFFKQYGYIPEADEPLELDHHKLAFEAFKRDRFRCWRDMPKVVKRIKQAAKKAAKAKGLEKLTEESKGNV